jgi:acyl carrier protein
MTEVVMTNNKKEIFSILAEILKEFAQEKDLEQLKNPTEETPLYGSGGTLDSLALVRLAVELEERIGDRLGKDISIVDDRAMSQKRSPFKNVGTFVDYLTLLVEEVN